MSGIPDWYRDAKLGIKFHWGPAAVAGFSGSDARTVSEMLREDGWDELFRNHPDGRWYLNSLRIGRPDAIGHHKSRFSAGVTYEQLSSRFNADLNRWDPAEWATLCRETGARYLVMAAKDPDGYLFWPSEAPPDQPERMATRDVVGDLAQAVRAADLRFGIAYSGLLDWSHCAEPVRAFQDVVNHDRTGTLGALVDSHYRELIQRYAPDLLWNEDGLPSGMSGGRLRRFYNHTVDLGVLVGGWRPLESWFGRTLPAAAGSRFAAASLRAQLTEGPRPIGRQTVAVAQQLPEKSSGRSWEYWQELVSSRVYSNSGSGASTPNGTELVHLLADVVSRNGNLLLSVAPRPDGVVPANQTRPLVDLSRWLRQHGESIYGTRPWYTPAGTTACGLPVRYTTAENALYCIVLGRPSMLSLTMGPIDLRRIPETRASRRDRYELVISLLGFEYPVESRVGRDSITVNIPGGFIPTAATVVKVSWEPPVKAARSAGFFTDVI